MLELTVYYIYKRFFYEENMDGNKYGFFFLKKISFYKANINWDRNLFKILLLLSSLLFIFILFYVDFQ